MKSENAGSITTRPGMMVAFSANLEKNNRYNISTSSPRAFLRVLQSDNGSENVFNNKTERYLSANNGKTLVDIWSFSTNENYSTLALLKRKQTIQVKLMKAKIH